MKQTRKWMITAMAVLIGAVMCVGPAIAGEQGTVEHDWSAGTHTVKLTLNVATTTGFGHSHWSAEAVKTQWVSVPIMKDFIFVIEQASDSAAGFAGVGQDGDTVHIALETASSLSLIVLDSTGTTNMRSLAKTVWWNSDLNWSGFILSRYVAVRYTDTIAGQTNDGGLPAFGGIFPKNAFNEGMLRFSLCGDDADSATDGAIALNCYIIYHETSPQKSYGYVPNINGAPYDCMEADYESYAYVPRYYDHRTWGGQ